MGIFRSSDSLNYSRDGFYSHPAATAEAVFGSLYHHPLEPPWVGSRFTLTPTSTTTGLGRCLRFVSPVTLSAHSHTFPAEILQSHAGTVRVLTNGRFLRSAFFLGRTELKATCHASCRARAACIH